MPSTSNKLFVSVPSDSTKGLVIFGVNSFRRNGEVQEVVYLPAMDNSAASVIKCANTEVEQVQRVNATILSKSVDCWGAEMGANEHGVCISFTQLNSCCHEDGLSGQDLVRLGLERGSSAENAVDVLSGLITHHGLAGAVVDAFPAASVSMLICDQSEAWILEAAGKHLAAVRVKSGDVKCLDGQLVIRTEFDKSSSGLQEFATQHQRWSDSDGDFDFAKAFSNSPADNVSSCSFQQIFEEGQVTPQSMLQVLRHSEYSSSSEGFSVAGSQLSLLPRSIPSESGSQHFLPVSVHWFTATPRPDLSFFKPFVFSGDQVSVCERTTAAGRTATSEHSLWIAHRRFTSRLDAGDKKSESVLANIRELEQKCFEDIDELIHGEPSSASVNSAKNEQVMSLFEHMVDLEINFYN